MQLLLPTIIIRHQRENLKKCSLRGLEQKAGFQFFSYPKSQLPGLKEHLMLALDAPLLTKADGSKGLLILDGTWRYSKKMEHFVQSQSLDQTLECRSLPSHFRTAYPRRQEDCNDPERGLASIEAIYIAYWILGRDVTGLLDNYHWKDLFLQKNNWKT
jgi:pre-rRNA-processing protein TSR3